MTRKPREFTLPLGAEDYKELYLRAFARLDDVAACAERAMKELEELRLTLEERAAAAPKGLILFPAGEKEKENF